LRRVVMSGREVKSEHARNMIAGDSRYALALKVWL
jgi:hypothetical protein